MDLDSIKLKLKTTNDLIDENVIDSLKNLKHDAVKQDNQIMAKNIWCLEQIIQIKNYYIDAFNSISNKEYFNAWTSYERIEIELMNLRRHFDYSGNKYNLEFIEEYVQKFQKLFPYFIFTSREAVINKARCSICNKEISIRHPCGHKIGEIYNGEMCVREIIDAEILAIAVVTNPLDKYTVLFPQDMEYDYSMLDNLMKYVSDPYDKWKLEIIKRKRPEYKNVGRNEKCPCGSEKKYKNCCLKTGKDEMDHYKISLYNKKFSVEKPLTIYTKTWK